MTVLSYLSSVTAAPPRSGHVRTSGPRDREATRAVSDSPVSHRRDGLTEGRQDARPPRRFRPPNAPHPQQRFRPSFRPCRGYTLVETLISLMVVSFIALTVAAILQTAAYGTSTQRDVRRTVVRGRQVHARMGDAIRNARAALACGSDYLVLWTGDNDANGQVNRSELQLIQLVEQPGGVKTLTAYTGQWVAGDPVYPAGSNFYAVAQAAKSSGHFPAMPWMSGVSNLTFTLDDASPVQARLVNWSMTLTNGQESHTVAGCASLRAPSEPN